MTELLKINYLVGHCYKSVIDDCIENNRPLQLCQTVIYNESPIITEAIEIANTLTSDDIVNALDSHLMNQKYDGEYVGIVIPMISLNIEVTESLVEVMNFKDISCDDEKIDDLLTRNYILCNSYTIKNAKFEHEDSEVVRLRRINDLETLDDIRKSLFGDNLN